MKKPRTSSMLVPDCVDFETLQCWMMNPKFGDFNGYKQCYGQIIETLKINDDNSITSRYWKFVKVRKQWKAYEVTKEGTVIEYGSSFDIK